MIITGKDTFEACMLMVLGMGLAWAVMSLFGNKSKRSAKDVMNFLEGRDSQSDEDYASHFPNNMRDCSLVIRHIIAKEYAIPVERIYPTDNILDVAIPCSDGMDMVSIVMKIEGEFDIRFPSLKDDKEADDLLHIDKLTRYVFGFVNIPDNEANDR